MSFKAWLSVVTFVLIGVVLYFSRHELLLAWELLGEVNIWILLLLIPAQIVAYLAVGQMVFSYLYKKRAMDPVKPFTLARLSLELNFVNHILPSGGVSGFSYMNWRLGKFGVSQGRAAMAQVVRYAMGGIAFLALLLVSVLAVTVDGELNRWIILVSTTLVGIMVGGMFGGIFLVSSRSRMERFARWSSRVINKFVKRVTFGRRSRVVSSARIENAFIEMHDDYIELRRDRRVLKEPLIWAFVFTIFDVMLFVITFWALGHLVNPAPVLIAYGVATLAGFIVITPGGAGAYEAIMVAFLAVAGISQGVAIAGILLTRVIVLITTIGLGYIFYQKALSGKPDGKAPL